MTKFDDERVLAARVAGSADLNEVRLFNVEATLDQLPVGPGGLSYEFDTNVEVQHVAETNTVIVDGRYRLVVHFRTETGPASEDLEVEDAPALDESDTLDHEHQHLAHLNFQLAALYALADDVEPVIYSEEELHAFGQTTGLLTLHPYAREFVADMTGRMGLPTLHLGTMRFNIDKPESASHDQTGASMFSNAEGARA